MPCVIYQIPVPGTVSSLPYGCQEHIVRQNIEYRIIMYCTLTYYWTIMNSNDRHYILNEYRTSTCWEKTVIP